MQTNNRSKRNRIGLGTVPVVIVSAPVCFFAANPSSVEADEPQLQTSIVRQGDLVLHASDSGTLIAGNEVELGFGANGQVAELYVQVGDEVQTADAHR